MCFYIDNKHPDKKIAKRDITCYKVVYDFKDKYFSQFKLKEYEIDKLYKQALGSKHCKYDLIIYHGSIGCKECYTIEEGIHSYSVKKIAKKHTEDFLQLMDTQLIVVKCIIPKGSEYYYNSEEKEYVSNQIIIKERI